MSIELNMTTKATPIRPESVVPSHTVPEVALTPNQRAVHDVLMGRKLTDADLVREYHQAARNTSLPQQSESGIRTRRKELVRKGLVCDVGTALSESGRTAKLWRAIPG